MEVDKYIKNILWNVTKYEVRTNITAPNTNVECNYIDEHTLSGNGTVNGNDMNSSIYLDEKSTLGAFNDENGNLKEITPEKAAEMIQQSIDGQKQMLGDFNTWQNLGNGIYQIDPDQKLQITQDGYNIIDKSDNPFVQVSFYEKAIK